MNGKDFQTVINILDSHKTVVSKESKSRNSFVGSMKKFGNKIDNIKETSEKQLY